MSYIKKDLICIFYKWWYEFLFDNVLIVSIYVNVVILGVF